MLLNVVVMDELFSQKGFSIFHLNIRSLTPKLDQLRSTFENRKIDIFTISETWLHKGICSNILSIPGYSFARYDRETLTHEHMVKRGGGLGIYYDHSLLHDADVYGEYNCSNKDLELQIVQFTRKNARKTVIFNVYRPPTGALDVAIDHLNEAILAISHVDRKDIVVLGDFNVDILEKRHKDTKALIYFASTNGLVQLIDSPTRCTSITDKAIDLIFTNMDYIAASGTIDMFISDHQPVFLIKKKPRVKQSTIKFSGRTYRNYDREILHEKLDQTLDQNRIIVERDPSVCWDYLLEDITKVANEITPKKEYKIKSERPCWLTNDLLVMQKDRDYFYKKAKKTKKQEDWFVARRHRNSVNTAISTAKSTFIKEELDRNKSNPKKIWIIIHDDILPDKKTQTFKILHPDTQLPLSNDEIPGKINDFFCKYRTQTCG